MSPKKSDIIFVQNHDTKMGLNTIMYILIEHQMDRAILLGHIEFSNIWVKTGLFTFYDDKDNIMCL